MAIGMQLKKLIIRLIPLSLRNHLWMQKLKVKRRFYNVLKPRLSRQFAISGAENTLKPYQGKKVLIPIIETSHYQHQHILGIAKALQLRGADVRVLICGGVLDGCEVKSVRNEGDPDPCWTCRFYASHTTPLYKLDTFTLTDYITSEERDQIRRLATHIVSTKEDVVLHGVMLNNTVEDSLIRYFYGAVPKDRNKVSKVKVNNAMSALQTTEIAFRIDQEWSPDVVLAHMSCYSPWGSFYKYYKNHGNRFRLVSLNPYDFKRINFNLFELNEPERFANWLAHRESNPLNEKEKQELREFLSNRFSGGAEIFLREGYFDSNASAKVDEIVSESVGKRRVFLFSNIYWDVGMSDMSDLYSDVISWVLRTISLLDKQQDIHLYIKTHPGEVYDSSSSLRGVAQIIREHYPVLPSNLTIIEPESKISPYELFPYIDVGVIYSGTLGLEMMLSGVPVISTGKTTHFGLGFSAEPKSESEYLDLLLARKAVQNFKREDLERFAYYYFIRTSMPWTLTKQAYGDNFDGFSFDSLDEILPGENPVLDHLCHCIMDYENAVPEDWPEPVRKQVDH